MDINELRGLLEPSAQDRQDALSMGLLGLGSGLLANSTGHYGQFAPAWGQGLQSGLQGYQGGLNQARENRMQDIGLRLKMAEWKKKQDQDQKTQEILGTLTPEQQRIYALGGGDALAKTLMPQTLHPSDILAREKFEWEKKQKGREGTGVKPQFNENLGGFVEPPSAQFPQGRVIPLPGIKPKVKGEGDWKYDSGSDQWVAPPTPENPEGLRSGNVGKQQAAKAMQYIIGELKGTKEKPGALYTATTGGPLGIYGSIGRATNTQQGKRFENLREQMSVQLRTLFRIPGEGTLSDREQAQYGLQLPQLGNDVKVNEAIIKDIENVIAIRAGQNKPNTGDASDSWKDL